LIKNFVRQDLEQALFDMEVMARAIGIKPFEIYLLGGSGCILAGYLDRATRDFDIVDLDYQASFGRVLKILEPYDLIDIQLAAIPVLFKERAMRLKQFQYLLVYVLSREDIIISKLPRFNNRDRDDISELLNIADVSLVFTLAKSTLDSNMLPSVKQIFFNNLSYCMEENHVPNYVQQLEKLRKRF